MQDELHSNEQIEKKEVVSTPVVGNASNNKRLFVIGSVSLVVVVAAIITAAGFYKIYSVGDTSGFAGGVAKALHLPIAKVNGTYIPYSEYLFDRNALKQMVKYDMQNSNGSLSTPPLSESEISNQVLSRLIGNVLLDNLAKKYQITVSQVEIDNLKKEVLASFKTTAEAESDLQKRYGWTIKTYEDRVMKPYILQNSLNEKIQKDEALRKEIKQVAQNILDQIKKGASFADMAKQYGEDASSQQAGDLGWFGKGKMVPEFEAVAFKLKKGEVAPELVETQFGYHIVRVDDQRVEKKKDQKGKMVNDEQVKASHILFRFPSLETVLSKEIKKAAIVTYGKIENPFKKLAATPVVDNN
jgi:parvulin-like peptidyl-prolyl isomerase